MAAAHFKAPQLELEPAEARAIASALADVQKHYKIPVMREDHMAIANLATVLGVTYGKRIMGLGPRKMAPPPFAPTATASAPPQTEPWFTGDISPIVN